MKKFNSIHELFSIISNQYKIFKRRPPLIYKRSAKLRLIYSVVCCLEIQPHYQTKIIQEEIKTIKWKCLNGETAFYKNINVVSCDPSLRNQLYYLYRTVALWWLDEIFNLLNKKYYDNYVEIICDTLPPYPKVIPESWHTYGGGVAKQMAKDKDYYALADLIEEYADDNYDRNEILNHLRNCRHLDMCWVCDEFKII